MNKIIHNAPDAASEDPEPDSPALIDDSPLNIEASVNDARWQPLCDDILAHGHFVWQVLGLPACDLSLVLDNDAAVHALNRDYRGKDKPTNVLSFPALDFDQPATAEGFPPPPVLLGDVVMAYETMHDEAAKANISLAAHAQHLLTHGILHLIGHDHDGAAAADVMERLEIDILARRGIDNPYAADAADAADAGDEGDANRDLHRAINGAINGERA